MLFEPLGLLGVSNLTFLERSDTQVFRCASCGPRARYPPTFPGSMILP